MCYKRTYLLINLTLMLFVCGNLLAQNKEQKNSYLVAQQYISENRDKEAISILEDLIDKNFTEQYYLMLSDVYKRTEENKKLEKLIKKAIKQNNNNSIYIIDLGNFYSALYDTLKAEKQYDRAINELQANNSDIQRTASKFISQRNYDYAEKTYKRGRELLKNSNAYTYELSYIYQTEGKNKEIAQEYISLLDNNPMLINQIEVNLSNLFNRDKDENLKKEINEFILNKVQKNPENESYLQLYYWLLMQNNDYAEAFIQAKAIDKRFYASDGRTVNDFAVKCMNNKQYKYALQGFNYLMKLSNEEQARYDVKLNRMNCLYNEFISKATFTQKEIHYLQSEYEKTLQEIGYNKQSSEFIRQYAHLKAYYLNDAQGGVDLLDTLINMRQLSTLQRAECKLDRADIYLISGDIWEASLTYSQVEKDMKNEVIGSEAKFKNAMLSYYTGDEEWALSQFEVLRASTTKLIANDAMQYSLLIKENMDEDSTYKGLILFAKADFALYQNKILEAERYLDTIDNYYTFHPLFDEILYKRAEIAIKQKDYQRADSLLNEIIVKYPTDLVADDAIFLMATINEEQFSNKQKAKELYEKIILEYPSSVYVSEARKRYSQ